MVTPLRRSAWAVSTTPDRSIVLRIWALKSLRSRCRPTAARRPLASECALVLPRAMVVPGLGVFCIRFILAAAIFVAEAMDGVLCSLEAPAFARRALLNEATLPREVSASRESRRRWACAGLMSVLLRGHTRHRQNHRHLGTDSKAELAMSCQDMPTSEETHARGQG